MGYLASGQGAVAAAPGFQLQSRLAFRGPWQVPGGAYCVALGGSATYGRFLPMPWPQQLERLSRRRVLNLGLPHAGPDAYLAEARVMETVIAADLRLIEVPDAVNLSNPLYSVHVRRNDRFLRASPQLQRLYPEVDFTEFAFTRHMIGTLARHGEQRFAVVCEILGRAWAARMAELLDLCDGPSVMVWLGDRAPPERADSSLNPGAPLLVSKPMIEGLRPRLSGYAEVLVDDFCGGLDGKTFADLERPAAMASPGSEIHEEAALHLLPFLRGRFQ